MKPGSSRWQAGSGENHRCGRRSEGYADNYMTTGSVSESRGGAGLYYFRKPWKRLISAFVILLIIAALFARCALSNVQYYASSSLASELASYLTGNDMVFPRSWHEFISWRETNGQEDGAWAERVLEKSFELPWGRKYCEVSESDQIITSTADHLRAHARQVTRLLKDEMQRLEKCQEAILQREGGGGPRN